MHHLTLGVQMLSYESQLDLKRNVVVKAYHNFSGRCAPPYIFSITHVPRV
jgi:tRNA/tmRNA/rRNA uracil-C5-methylase (TrmA/RlmC/RlmD family)